jgi:hypothetical protein
MNQRITSRDCEFYIGTTRIGGAESMSLEITHDLTDAHEAGSHFPVEIIDGKISIKGDLKRAFIDVDLINAIAPNTTGLWPEFTIVSQIVSGKTPARTITVMGAKFGGITIEDLSLDAYAKNTLSFQAKNYSFSS